MSDTPGTPPEPAPDQPTGSTPTPAGGESVTPGPGPGAPAEAAGPVAYAAAGTASEPDAADVEKNKVFALLSYIGILWLVPLLAAKESPYAKYHCNQGILLSIVAFGLGMALGIVSFVLGFIPFVNIVVGCLSCVVFPAYVLAVMAFSILGIINAVNGKMKPLPLFPVVNWVK